MTRGMTLRTRVTLAYTAIVAVAAVLLGTIAFVTVRFALESAFVTRLDTTARSIRSIVDVRHGRMKRLQGEDLVQFESLLGGGLNGAVLRSNDSDIVSNLSSPPRSVLTQLDSSVHAKGIVRIDRGPIAYVLLPVTEGGTRYGTIFAWASRSTYDDAQRITLIALGGAGIIVIAAGAAIAGTLTRRMLQPVSDLSVIVSEIEATDLGERIAWEGPDDELGSLCATFDRLLDRLETAFQRERRFIADASHELRTPLSVLRAEVELALMQERTPEAYRSVLQRLLRETQRLETLAESLIVTTREAGAEPAELVSASDVAAGATRRMQPLAASRGITLTYVGSSSENVVADAGTLERAIVAVIENALRFARREVSVGVTRDAERVDIAVRDDGPGFSSDALREATGRFWRDNGAPSGEGTGLGLAIARSIAERNHGTIALRNAGVAGALVTLSFPMANNSVTA